MMFKFRIASLFVALILVIMALIPNSPINALLPNPEQTQVAIKAAVASDPCWDNRWNNSVRSMTENHAHFENNSSDCTYRVGLSNYDVYTFYDQVSYMSVVKDVGPGESADFDISAHLCDTQQDFHWGDTIIANHTFPDYAGFLIDHDRYREGVSCVSNTDTPVPTSTSTNTPVPPTITNTPTFTATPQPTNTSSPTFTSTPRNTLTPTSTSTNTPSMTITSVTATPTTTNTPTTTLVVPPTEVTNTSTPQNTATFTPTNMPPSVTPPTEVPPTQTPPTETPETTPENTPTPTNTPSSTPVPPTATRPPSTPTALPPVETDEPLDRLSTCDECVSFSVTVAVPNASMTDGHPEYSGSWLGTITIDQVQYDLYQKDGDSLPNSGCALDNGYIFCHKIQSAGWTNLNEGDSARIVFENGEEVSLVIGQSEKVSYDSSLPGLSGGIFKIGTCWFDYNTGQWGGLEVFDLN